MTFWNTILEGSIRFLSREKRDVRAYITSYPLIAVSAAWQQDLQVTYQGTPITGFQYYSIVFRNHGNKAVKGLPFNVVASSTAIIAWPMEYPQGCVQGMANPSTNTLSGVIDFINPKEEVNVSFWTFEDTTGTITVTARLPDVVFAVESWRTHSEKIAGTSFKIGAWIHQTIFWIGGLFLLYLFFLKVIPWAYSSVREWFIRQF